MDIADRGRRLIDLHTDPEILRVVNVWDVPSAKVIADLPQTTALATASHSIAATFGYPDGEHIPLAMHLGMIERIVHVAGDLPVTADLEAGHGAPGETIRRALGAGVVGANLEDRLAPFADSVAAGDAAVRAAEAEQVPFALNARTDAFSRPGDRPTGEVLADAIERGRAYLDAGAACVFVPGRLTDEEVEELVAALGEQRISVIGLPGAQSAVRFQDLGVARISYGPWTQRLALTALQDRAVALYAGEGIPTSTRALN